MVIQLTKILPSARLGLGRNHTNSPTPNTVQYRLDDHSKIKSCMSEYLGVTKSSGLSWKSKESSTNPSHHVLSYS